MEKNSVSETYTYLSCENAVNLVFIEYPGIGKNVKQMIETLGGIRKISEVYSKDNQRLELCYDTENIYNLPICGDLREVKGLLLKIKCRRKKKKNKPSIRHEENYIIETVGIVNCGYKFEEMWDFAYLPMGKKISPGVYESIYSRLLPYEIVSSDWIDEPSHIYLPPLAYSRFSTPQEYYLNNNTPASSNVEQTSADTIGKTRLKRTSFAHICTFEVEAVPTESMDGAMSQLKCTVPNSLLYDELIEIFKERPIWSKWALTFLIDATASQLKVLLPTVAYYFSTGPWRTLWVRLGFDPRTNTDSWCYQTHDFRLKPSQANEKVAVKVSQRNYVQSNRNVKPGKRKLMKQFSLSIKDPTRSRKSNFLERPKLISGDLHANQSHNLIENVSEENLNDNLHGKMANINLKSEKSTYEDRDTKSQHMQYFKTPNTEQETELESNISQKFLLNSGNENSESKPLITLNRKNVCKMKKSDDFDTEAIKTQNMLSPTATKLKTSVIKSPSPENKHKRSSRSSAKIKIEKTEQYTESNLNSPPAVFDNTDSLSDSCNNSDLESDVDNSIVSENTLNTSTYIIKEGQVPPYRQVYYQYCDIDVPKIQRILKRNLVGYGIKCSKRNGWLKSRSADEKCRAILEKMIKTALDKDES